ncbi:uncharacterized protein RSE6_00318 [Rhynchosporium secalis]|uniref:Uncharacterized protein n=1 Tax=Rhynchosporium secalis TaxID=38038 RepID=A0A1E1LUY0_RHYSE|nr:uncharacterized protein RSE6_00318 [Rhynchosporium secalis]
MAPGPFCCYNAVPSTLRYATSLLPNTILYQPLAKSKGSAPLLTCFLAHLLKTNLPIPSSAPEKSNHIFFVIIQVKKTHPLEQKNESKAKNTAKTAPSPASSSMSVISAPAAAPSTQVSGSRRINNIAIGAILGAIVSPFSNFEQASYFVAIEKSSSATVLDQNSPLFGRGFREIKTQEAMESLRFHGTGITIGDGEVWVERDGAEKFWCEAHRVWFEMKVWVREGGGV